MGSYLKTLLVSALAATALVGISASTQEGRNLEKNIETIISAPAAEYAQVYYESPLAEVITAQIDLQEVAHIEGFVGPPTIREERIEKKRAWYNRQEGRRSMRAKLEHTQNAWGGAIETAARRYEIPLSLMIAMIAVESGGRPRAESPRGAYGLMQLMPDTASYIEKKTKGRLKCSTLRKNSYVNVMCGAWFLQRLHRKFEKRYGADLPPIEVWDLALGAYNRGAKGMQDDLRRNKARTYWEAKRLNIQLWNYVPGIRAAERIWVEMNNEERKESPEKK